MFNELDKFEKRVLLIMIPISIIFWILFSIFIVHKVKASTSNGDYIYIENKVIIDDPEDENRNDPYMTKSFTVPDTCINPYLLIISETWEADDITSITYDNVSLTRLYYAYYTAGHMTGYIYGLVAPHVGTHEIKFTYSNIGERPSGIILLCNVNPDDPIGTSFVNTGDQQNAYHIYSGTIADYENDNSFLLSVLFSYGNDVYASDDSQIDFLATKNWNNGVIYSAYNDNVSNSPSQFQWDYVSGSIYGANLTYGVFNYIAPNTVNSLSITSPTDQESEIKETWITVSGTCSINGEDRIALTNSCSDFSDLNYTVSCVDNEFSADFYYNGLSDWVVAVDVDSEATDCVNYDDLIDMIKIDGIEVIEGYPDEWYFNYDYYDDYDIKIISPTFDMPAMTLPLGTTNVDTTFSFVYPRPLSPNLVFHIKQYDENGTLLNDSYHNKALYEMADTNNYSVNLSASTTPYHYVVQILNNGDVVRQYPFGVFVSDVDLIINPDDYRYLFPRLVEEMKKKVVFNYYFAFYDGFYSLFNGNMDEVSGDDLDINFKSVSANGEYNLDIPIFTASNSVVKDFSNGLRPYIVGLLWLGFAIYVLVRVNGLFGDNS